ncbi:HalOD1 output domain-containing protein [Haloarcula amylovorans]|uniref:HalOD1 output domain-containing protein n=1 Tax=Haloarcula amylovorans TaxID=2562280 RepID=UPI001076911A|nr:HalOD1 output domain-containing protein [Halomicroarcula amylolytica]
MKYEIAADERVSEAVLAGVSRFESTAVSDLPLLYGAIDPDALEVLLTSQENTCVSFVYSNSRIEIHDKEFLTVEAT